MVMKLHRLYLNYQMVYLTFRLIPSILQFIKWKRKISGIFVANMIAKEEQSIAQRQVYYITSELTEVH